MKIITHNVKKTQKIAAQLAKKILFSTRYSLRATVIALVGNLGGGKTTFTQGFAKGLGIKHRMVSPTFLIMRKYSLEAKSEKRKIIRIFIILMFIESVRQKK